VGLQTHNCNTYPRPVCGERFAAPAQPLPLALQSLNQRR